MVEFNLPVVFTISPYDPSINVELFKNYARTMTNIKDQDIETTITSVVHGESRILSATMGIDEMFSDRSKFKSMVSDKIAKDLEQFGLKICNANIEELHDILGNEYFSNLKKKALAGADNQSRIEVAEAKKLGDCGEQERKAATIQRIAQLDAETAKIKNQRDCDIAESIKQLEVSKSQFMKEQQLAKIEADMAAKQRETELQREVEAKRVEQEIQTLRAQDLVKATVEGESLLAKTKADAEAQQRMADATLYSEQKKAEARIKIADAMLYEKIKEAEGLTAIYQTEADGVNKILQSCNGDADLYKFKLAMDSNLYPQLADKNAQAIHGLKPKINVWNTGSGNNDTNNNPYKSIQDIVKMVPPLLDVLNTQTDIKLPNFLSGTGINGDNISKKE